MKTLKLLSFLCALCGLFFYTSCNTYKPSITRQNLKMPKLVDFKKFKNEIPIDSLKSLSDYANRKGYGMPLLIYHFSIDTAGNVVNGKWGKEYNNFTNFFKSYINKVFNTYKWLPANYDKKKKEMLRSVAYFSITEDDNRRFFEVSIRLTYLPNKERVQDILEEKNLIYHFKIR